MHFVRNRWQTRSYKYVQVFVVDVAIKVKSKSEILPKTTEMRTSKLYMVVNHISGIDSICFKKWRI